MDFRSGFAKHSGIRAGIPSELFGGYLPHRFQNAWRRGVRVFIGVEFYNGNIARLFPWNVPCHLNNIVSHQWHGKPLSEKIRNSGRCAQPVFHHRRNWWLCVWQRVPIQRDGHDGPRLQRHGFASGATLFQSSRRGLGIQFHITFVHNGNVIAPRPTYP